VVVLLEEEKILFAADTLMAVPHFVDGDYNALVASLRSLQQNSFEIVVQGHGDILMKGEIEPKITSDLAYMKAVMHYANNGLKQTEANAIPYLDSIGVERCGKSRLLLNGTVRDLHRANMRALYETLYEQRARAQQAETGVASKPEI
jgi:cyclase